MKVLAIFDITWKNTIFARLLATFILVMIPIYALGISIYNWGISSVRSNLVDTTKSQVNFYLKSLGNDIRRARNLQFDCVNDEDLNQLANKPAFIDDVDKVRAILRLQNRLNSIKSSSSYISNACSHIPAINTTIDSPGYPKGSINELRQEEMAAMVNSHFSSKSQFIFWKERIFLSTVFPVYPDEYTNPQFVIELELSGNELRNALKQLDDMKNSGSFLIDLTDGRLLVSDVDENYVNRIFKSISAKTELNREGTATVQIDGKPYLAIYAKSEYLNLALVKYIPEYEIYNTLKKYQFWFWIFSLAAVMIIALYSFSTYRYMYKPLLKLIKSFKKIEHGDLDVRIEHKHNDEFRYLYSHFNEMTESLNSLIDQVYMEKILAQKAELKQLQAQINPHFLYNTYFILYNMLKTEDYDTAMNFAKLLGSYLKYITRSTADEVLLTKEIDHAKVYTEIQGLRFSSRISINFGELPDACNSIMVPRLILQPIIENAFEHGLKNKAQDGILNISFKNTASELLIVVEDNGDCPDFKEINRLNDIFAGKASSEEITGIINTNKRLQIKFGSLSGLFLSRSELGGLRVEMKLLMKGDTVDVQTFDC